MAAAPGHPFLAKVIERVVNNVRNRFTAVDVDRQFCPNPELSVLHAYDILFTAGPCILGAMVNEALGRNGQTHFNAGELPLADNVPGRSIILNQGKNDVSYGDATDRENAFIALALTSCAFTESIYLDGSSSLYALGAKCCGCRH